MRCRARGGYCFGRSAPALPSQTACNAHILHRVHRAHGAKGNPMPFARSKVLWWRPQATEPAEEEGGGLRRGRLYTIEDQWLLRYVVHCTTKALTLWNRLFSSIRFRSNVETSIGETSGGESVYGLRSLVVSRVVVRVRRVETCNAHRPTSFKDTTRSPLCVHVDLVTSEFELL